MPATDKAAEADPGSNILLKNLVPLNALSDEHLGQLISRVSIEKAASGQFLFREGDTDHQNVYLLDGKVVLLAGDREVDSVVSGSNMARFALAHQWPRKFSVRAVGPVRFVRIDSRQLSDMLVRTQSQSYRVSELEVDDGSDDWMSQVLRSRLFQHIPAANIQNILRRMEEQKVSKGDVIIRQGDPGDYFYVIIQGRCSVTRFQSGRVLEVARIGPGDCFGEEALVSGSPRGGTVTMVTNGILARLGKENFVELIQRPLTQSLSFPLAQTRVQSGALWVDLRGAQAYEAGHLPGSVNLPVETLRVQSGSLAPNREYVVYGEDTGKGAVGAFLLRERGFEVFVLDSGLAAVPARVLVREEDGAPADTGTAEPAVSVPLGVPQTPAPPPVAPAPIQVPIQERRPAELEEILRQTQERFQKVLYQRIAELRQTRQALEEAKQENLRLRAATQESAQDGLATAETHLQEALAEQDRLRAQVAVLRQELDDVNEVLQDASAEESTHQWEKVRWHERIQHLEHDLREQQEINRVLRQENEEILRRLEALGNKQARGDGVSPR